MTDAAVSFFYLFMFLLTFTLGVTLFFDAMKNHYTHKPMRPVVVWISAMFLSDAVFFLGLGSARLWRIAHHATAPWLLSWQWAALLIAMTVSIFGFYATLRRAR